MARLGRVVDVQNHTTHAYMRKMYGEKNWEDIADYLTIYFSTRLAIEIMLSKHMRWADDSEQAATKGLEAFKQYFNRQTFTMTDFLELLES